MKKSIKVLIAVVVSLFAILFALIALINSNSDEEPTQPVGEITTEEVSVSQNSTAMVDKIINQAKDDSKTATDEEINAALDYLHKNINHCFDSNEAMENFIYYGALLDSKFEDDNELSVIGFQAVKTVKYVYRGVEAISDPVTAGNVKELREMLEDYYE